MLHAFIGTRPFLRAHTAWSKRKTLLCQL